MTLRTKKMEHKYTMAKLNGDLKPLLEEEPIVEFSYWKIVLNRFPHDKHHRKHILIVLKRECEVFKISPDELQELWYDVLPWAETQGWHYTKLNFQVLRSVNHTPHLHLLTLKPEYV